MSQYNNMTFEKIMRQALDEVPADEDKRQGSIIYDALAPAVAALTQIYIQLEHILSITFAETSFGDWLTKRCAEMGVNRQPHTKAIRLGTMYDKDNHLLDIPLNSRFNLEELNYIVMEKISPGTYKLQCEQYGIIGNKYFGKMIPVDYIEKLVTAQLSDVIVPGEDEETDKDLYNRYVEVVNSTPYGGNIDDYRQKVKAIPGIGGCKVYPVWNGGGTVKLVIINSENKPPSDELVKQVQSIICPEPHKGKGVAPIGHDVTVNGAEGKTIRFETTLLYKSGVTSGQVQEAIKITLENYFSELSSAWETEDFLIVRINQIEARILSIDGILDISGTALNGGLTNISLGADEIPLLGEVALNG